MNGFLKALLYLSFSGTLMALLLFALKPIAKKRLSKRFWYYLWIPVLLRLCLPLGGIVSIQPLADEKATTVAVQTESAENVQTLVDVQMPVDVQTPVDVFVNDTQHVTSAQNTTGFQQSAASTQTVDTVKPVNGRPQQEAHSVETTEEDFGTRLLEAAKLPLTWSVVWATGAVLLTAFHLWSYRRFVRAVKRSSIPATREELAQLRAMCGERKTPGLRVCPLVSTPMLIGLFRPVVILPAGEYTQEELANILRHELSHYRRKDLVYKWAALVVNALHWFNPVVWLVRREINNACELACDEAVICGMSETERRSYGATLLNMAASRRLPAGIVATTMATNHIKGRIINIMKYKKMTALTLVVAVLLSAVLCGCGAVFGAPDNKEEEATQAFAPIETVETATEKETDEVAETINEEEETLTQEEQLQRINEFLSSVVQTGYSVFDPADQYELLSFAFMYSELNLYSGRNPSAIYVEGYDFVIKRSDVDELLNRFFGTTVSLKGNVDEVFSSKNLTGSGSITYQTIDDAYHKPAASGDQHYAFAIADHLSVNSDGTYTVNFTVYEGSYTPDRSVYYGLTPDEAAEQSKPCASGTAVLIDYTLPDGTASYQIVSYQRELAGQTEETSNKSAALPRWTPDESVWNAEDVVYDLYSSKNSYGVITRIPQFKGDTADIQRINREIEEKYLRDVDERLGNGDYIDYFLTGTKNVYSLVIKNHFSGGDQVFYDVYNLDTSGNELSNSELLKIAGISEEDYIAQEKQSVERIFNNRYPAYTREMNQTFAEEQLARTIEGVDLNDKMFLDGENGLKVVTQIYALAGADSYEYINPYAS